MFRWLWVPTDRFRFVNLKMPAVYMESGMRLDEEPTQQPLKENAVDAMRNVIMNSSGR